MDAHHRNRYACASVSVVAVATFNLVACLLMSLACFGFVWLDAYSDAWTWAPASVTGDAPSPRAGHTSTQLGAMMLVFGGGTGWNGQTFNDLHVLDTSAMRWYRYVAATSLC